MLSKQFPQVVVRITILTAVVGTAVGFFVPIPPNDLGEVFFTIPLVVACAVLYIGAVILLFSSLPKFKFKLRQAYKVLIAGMILIAIAQLLIPIVIITNLLDNPWLAIPQSMLYPIAMVCLYVGTRNFGKLIQIRGWSTSFLILLATFLPVSALIVFVTQGRFEIVGFAFITWLAIFAAAIMWQAKKQASKIYTASMFWLALGLAAFSLSLIVFTLLQVNSNLSDVMKQILEDIPPVVSGACLLVGAYRFYNINGGTGLAELPLPPDLSSSIDIVVYAASLASNPQAIDPLLDIVRVITTAETTTISDEQQEKLKQAYISLEEYLAHQDPLRSYDIAQLRETITKGLETSQRKGETFWVELSPLDTHSLVRAPETHTGIDEN